MMATDRVGGMAGTPAYLAPEIFKREPATPQSDIYSLGALLFHLASRAYPVTGRSLRELRDAHTRAQRVSLRAQRPDLPEALVTAINRALDADPRGRFASAHAFRTALQSDPRHARRGRPTVVAGVVLAIVASGFAVWLAPKPSSASAIPIHERGLVLVTVFDNRTGEALLDGTLEHALGHELARSASVQVVPDGRVKDILALMRRPADSRVDVGIGREVAIRDGQIRGLLSGRVDRVGGAYAVTLSYVRPSDGLIVFSLQAQRVSQPHLLAAIGRLAREVRRHLGESASVTPPPRDGLPRVATSSLRALQLYTQATAIIGDEGGAWPTSPQTVAQLLEEAVREDPDFAMAHVLLARNLLAIPDRRASALAQVELAVAAAERGTTLDRLAARAERHLLRTAALGPDRADELARAVAAWETLAQHASGSEWWRQNALVNLAQTYPQLHRHEEAVNAAKRLLEIRPNSFTFLWRAAVAALAHGDRGTARDFVNRALALGLPVHERTAWQSAWLAVFKAQDAWLADDPESALRIADRMADELMGLPHAAKPPYALQLVGLLELLGQLHRAEQLIPLVGTTEAQRFLRTRIVTATIGVATDKADEIKLQRLLARDYPDPDGARNIASVLIDAGRLQWARGILARDWTEPLPLAYLQLARGQLALAEKRPADAVAHLETLVQPEPGQAPPRGSRAWARAVIALAKAHHELGATAHAISLLEDASNRGEYEAQAAYAWLAVQFQLAQSYRGARRVSEADAVETHLHTLLAVADDDHPIKRRLYALRAKSTSSR